MAAAVDPFPLGSVLCRVPVRPGDRDTTVQFQMRLAPGLLALPPKLHTQRKKNRRKRKNRSARRRDQKKELLQEELLLEQAEEWSN